MRYGLPMRLRGIHGSVIALALASACFAEPAIVSSTTAPVPTTTVTVPHQVSETADSGAPAAETSPPPPDVASVPPEPSVRSLRDATLEVEAPRDGLATTRPPWLGTRVLELRADGFGVVPPTPPELIGRAFPPSARVGPAGDGFEATAGPVPADVLGRSTWHEGCPVAPEDLTYLTMTFRGFDGNDHVGEMIVHRSVADDVVGVFRALFEAGFPIEEMRVIAPAELDAPPTGDGNVTTSFVCRPAVGSGSWSQHASGLAIDVNPFQNPYHKGDVVLPELASHYLDRTLDLPGMIVEGGPVVTAFDAIGWGWGGRWRTLDDYHHFSANGR